VKRGPGIAARQPLFCVLLFSCAAVAAADTAALDTFFEAHVEPQGLSSAVLALSTQAGVQVVMPAGELDRYEAEGVHGHVSLRQALTSLLRSTPFRFRLAGRSTIVIEAAKVVADKK
jgi:hypothetical protein